MAKDSQWQCFVFGRMFRSFECDPVSKASKYERAKYEDDHPNSDVSMDF